MVESGMITLEKMQYFSTFISLAALFKGKDDCFDYLTEKCASPKYKNVITWNSLYGASLLKQIKVDKKRKLNESYNNTEEISSSDKLLYYMKQLVSDFEKGLTFQLLKIGKYVKDKAYFTGLLERVLACLKEKVNIERVMKDYNMKSEHISETLKELMTNLIEVIL
jgi:hypothetical protein